MTEAQAEQILEQMQAINERSALLVPSLAIVIGLLMFSIFLRAFMK